VDSKQSGVKGLGLKASLLRTIRAVASEQPHGPQPAMPRGWELQGGQAHHAASAALRRCSLRCVSQQDEGQLKQRGPARALRSLGEREGEGQAQRPLKRAHACRVEAGLSGTMAPDLQRAGQETCCN